MTPDIIALGNVPSPERRSGKMVTLDERVYTTANRKLAVPEGDPRAAFLLGGVGDQIPIEQAVELGLMVEDEDDDTEGDEPEVEESNSEDAEEKRRTPSRNKQRQPAQDK